LNDFLGGSSVGAINMALLSTGKITVKTLLEIYPDMIKKVFKKRGMFSIPFYDRKNFIEIWDDLIGKNFKMKYCKCKLQITSVNAITQRNHFFKSWEDKDGDEYLLDVVLRSFAAPLYFGKLIDNDNKKIWFDGGMGNANLPIDNIFIECRDRLKWDSDILQIDAFGCGFKKDDVTFEKAKRYKTIKQLLTYFDVGDGGLARAQSLYEQVNKMKFIAKYNKNIGFRYWDIQIPEKFEKLDGIKFIDDYKIFGIEMAQKPMLEVPYCVK
jgi:hypothetical protein